MNEWNEGDTYTHKTYGTSWVYLEGQYTEEELKDILVSFDKRREAIKKSMERIDDE